MTTDEIIADYRRALRSGKKFEVFKVYINDISKKGYYELTNQERQQVDLYVELAKESL